MRKELLFYSAHWPVLIAVLITLLNDHLLKKSSFAGTVTGKLSDFAGLFFFPFFVCDTIYLATKRRVRLRGFRILLFCCAGVFTFLKVPSEMQRKVVALYSSYAYSIVIVPDPTDLIALTSLVFAFAYYRKVSQS